MREKRLWSDISDVELGSSDSEERDKFGFFELRRSEERDTTFDFEDIVARSRERLLRKKEQLKERLKTYSSSSVSLLRSKLRTSRSPEILGICGRAASDWANEYYVEKQDHGFHCVHSIVERPVRPSDREVIIECLVRSLYHGTFTDTKDECEVALTLARKAAGVDWPLADEQETNYWEEPCWRQGALLSLLQRVIRGMFFSNSAKDIFDGSHYLKTPEILEVLHRGFVNMWRCCLAAPSMDGDRQRVVSKVCHMLSAYFRAFNRTRKSSYPYSRSSSPYSGWSQDTVNVVDLMQVFLPYYLDIVTLGSDEYRVMREVLNWALCPTDESVDGLHPLLCQEAIDSSGEAQRSLKFLLYHRKLLDPLTKLRWLQGTLHDLAEPDAAAVQLLVHREAPLQDLCDQLGITGFAHQDRPLNAGMMVRFAGEIGQDEGGLWREYVPMALLHLLDHRKGLFVLQAEKDSEGNLFQVVEPRWSATSAVPDATERSNLYELFGVLLGMVLAYHAPTSVHLSRAFLDVVLGGHCSEDIPPRINHHIQRLRELADCDPDAIEQLALTFSIDDAEFGETFDLTKNGRKLDVRIDNLQEYCQLYTKFWTEGCFSHMLPSFRRGFSRLVPDSVLAELGSIMSPTELDLIIAGESIDVEDWKHHTKYLRLQQNDSLVQWFWQAVEALSDLERKDLWVFCSGSKGLPPGGFGRLTDIRGEVTHFCVAAVEGSAQRLPVAHTCIYQLDLPSGYSSFDEVMTKLRLAIACGSTGFGLA